MRNFDKPKCEIVRFDNAVLTTSSCGCWDGEDDWGAGANCLGDIGSCTCQINHIVGTANCTPCSNY